MKILILAILVQFCTLYSSAQTSSKPTLSNSSWKGHIEIPQAMDILLEFRNDTVIVTADGIGELETMFFSQNRDTVKFRKLNGTSPCNDVAIGRYLVEWQENGDKIILHNIADDCTERANAITSAVAYFRIKK